MWCHLQIKCGLNAPLVCQELYFADFLTLTAFLRNNDNHYCNYDRKDQDSNYNQYSRIIYLIIFCLSLIAFRFWPEWNYVNISLFELILNVSLHAVFDHAVVLFQYEPDLCNRRVRLAPPEAHDGLIVAVFSQNVLLVLLCLRRSYLDYGSCLWLK